MPHVSRLLDAETIELLDRLSMSARRLVEGNSMGLHRSSLRGASVEFRQRRAYAPGDEPRRVDWRVLARTDKLFVKEYDEETNLRCAIAVDRSESMAYGGRGKSKFDYASRLAAALAYLMLSKGESVGFATFAATLDPWIGPRSHSAQLSHVIDALQRSQPAGRASMSVALSALADRMGRRGMIFVLSDLFSPLNELGSGLARLRHDRHEIVLLQIVDDDEMRFPFQSVGRFIGLESEQPIVAEPAMARAGYLDRLRRHQHGVAEMCRSLQVDHFLFPTSRAMVDALGEMVRLRNG